MSRVFYKPLQLSEGRVIYERHRSRCLVLNRTTLGTACPRPHMRLEQSGGVKLRVNVPCRETYRPRVSADDSQEQAREETLRNRVWET